VSYERNQEEKRHDPKQPEDYRRSLEIDKFLRGSILRGPSRIALGWDGFAIERHRVEVGERSENFSDHHFIVLWNVHSCHGERADLSGRYKPYFRRPGSLSLFAAGVFPAVRNFTKMEVIIGAASPALVSTIEDELDQRPLGQLNDKLNFQDAGLRMLMSLLIAESEAGGPYGRAYADSLIHALATRFVQLGRAMTLQTKPTSCGLPGHLLRRVLDRMNSEFSTDLGLATLAADSGYSRAHFLRMFRNATAQTPHQYLLNLRLEKATQMLKDRSSRLVDVAVACGFCSHTHFTKAFHTKFGVLPSHYRRL
jgi:AraC family transcriptional regulator